MPHKHNWDALGTVLQITIWDPIPKEKFSEIIFSLEKKVSDFENTFSRFKSDSLLSRLESQIGIIEVPRELTEMLQIYLRLYEISNKKFTPLIAGMLEDAGYNQEKTFVPKKVIEDIKDFSRVLEIVDSTHIDKKSVFKLDLGALGKGYMVDVLSVFLASEGIKRFLMDGSGDIYYSDNSTPIRIGLEHPDDTTKVIGIIQMGQGSMCSSATNKRQWNKYSHYIDPVTKESPTDIIAVWVIAKEAVVADALTSVLFFVAPESVKGYDFEYCVLNKEYKIKHSKGFIAEWF